MTRRRYAIFALLALALSTGLSVSTLAVVDVFLHRKYAALVGLNVWGYRGPLVGPKPSGESRIAVLGGSTVFGYGVPWNHALPAALERRLTAESRRVSVVNLAYNSEGAYAYAANLADYAYLGYDLAVFYTGYNDLTPDNRTRFRRQSPVFRLTGYLPIFPLIVREKAMALRYGGDLDEAYRSGGSAPPVTRFTQTALERGTAAGLEAFADITATLERQLGRLTDVDAVETAAVTTSCDREWDFYCRHMRNAIREALARGARVLVVGQPYISDGHVRQQRALEDMVGREFGNDPRVRTVNLGRAIDLRDPALAWDGMHLTAAGNARVADLLVSPVLSVLP
jgi:lysophospholipase L1-like esterase